MYTIQDLDINTYIKENFTKVEQEFLGFLIENFPENLLNFQKDGQFYENKPLIVLMLMIAKLFGKSRELILNLEHARDIKEIVEMLSIATSVEPEQSDIGAYEQYRTYNVLQENNKKLLALLAGDLGVDVDYNRLNSEDKDNYLKLLTKYSWFIKDNYASIRNRGTLSALVNLLRNFQKVEPGFDVAQLIILEPGETDEIVDPAETIPKDTVRIYLPNLPSSYAYAGAAPQSIGELGKYLLDPQSDLYELIMKVKPAGIVYQMLLTTVIYALTTSKVVRDNTSFMSDNSFEGVGGFRKAVELIASDNPTLEYDDIGTLVDNIKVKITPTVNTFYDIKPEIKIRKEKAESSIATDDIPGIEYNNPTDTIPKRIVVPRPEPLEQVEVTLNIKDSYDSSNLKTINKTFNVPEQLSLDKFIHEYTVYETDPKKQVFKMYNFHNRQEIYGAYLDFYRDDPYGQAYLGPGDSVIVPNLLPNPEQDPTFPVKGIICHIPDTKPAKGKFEWHFIVKRDGKTIKLQKDIDNITLPDIYGRRHFPLEITRSFYPMETFTATITNHNEFSIDIITAVKWEYNVTSNIYRLIPSVFNFKGTTTIGAKESKTLTFKPHLMYNLVEVPTGSEVYKTYYLSGGTSFTTPNILAAIQTEEGTINLIGNILKTFSDEGSIIRVDNNEGISKDYKVELIEDPDEYWLEVPQGINTKAKRVTFQATITSPSEVADSVYKPDDRIISIPLITLINPTVISEPLGIEDGKRQVEVRNPNGAEVELWVKEYGKTKTKHTTIEAESTKMVALDTTTVSQQATFYLEHPFLVGTSGHTTYLRGINTKAPTTKFSHWETKQLPAPPGLPGLVVIQYTAYIKVTNSDPYGPVKIFITGSDLYDSSTPVATLNPGSSQNIAVYNKIGEEPVFINPVYVSAKHEEMEKSTAKRVHILPYSFGGQIPFPEPTP